MYSGVPIPKKLNPQAKEIQAELERKAFCRYPILQQKAFHIATIPIPRGMEIKRMTLTR